ncbi:hypothetical protein RJ639_012086 [Escallonia herrerae]|uniref:Fe2OG dioxygenase domain-containing protein n=1 Tax=Escallonia herrerae TaxID=1293975 RepID=A0AA88VMM3_9ASTE|nr:hypothetical protein RJ639_012086 [Escallonia herrerae]
MGSLTKSKLPIIDFSQEKLKPGTDSWLSTANDVRKALEEYGCFVALYNEVSPETHDAMFSAAKDLYDLPMESKVKNTSDLLGFGYGGGFTTMPLFEYFGIEKATTLEGTQTFTDLMWPSGNDDFCETALLLSKKLAALGDMVLQMVFENYGVERYYDTQIEALAYLMRFIKYRAPMNNENNTGLRPHTDKGFLTILDQNQVKGLEIETKDGEWITFDPSPSAFVVVAGDGLMVGSSRAYDYDVVDLGFIFPSPQFDSYDWKLSQFLGQAWSNGRIHSPFHQVAMRGTEDKYTIALFSFMSGMVETPEELVDNQHPLRFKPFNHYGYLRYCGAEGMKYKHPIQFYCGV